MTCNLAHGVKVEDLFAYCYTIRSQSNFCTVLSSFGGGGMMSTDFVYAIFVIYTVAIFVIGNI
jgi:hypothetical protein